MSVRSAPAPPALLRFMAIIYLITNKINGCRYVGATTQSLEKRWRQHVNESHLDRTQNRKLYRDLRIHGEEKFAVEEIEQVNDDERFERETYWIEKLNTFRDGYNGTSGGAGRRKTDSDLDRLIATEYENNRTIREVANDCGFDISTIKNALKRKEVSIKKGQKTVAERYGIKVLMLDNDSKVIMSFESISSASEYLIRKGLLNGTGKFAWSHIKDACNGKRKTVAGYKWRFAER